MKKVFTVGVFDLLHFGHVELFRRAKQYGDYLIVAVQDDETVLKYKPEAKLVCPITDRVYMVDAIKYVDQVVVLPRTEGISSSILKNLIKQK